MNEYFVRPTFDFVQEILVQGSRIELLEPASLEKETISYAKQLMSYYRK